MTDESLLSEVRALTQIVRQDLDSGRCWPEAEATLAALDRQGSLEQGRILEAVWILGSSHAYEVSAEIARRMRVEQSFRAEFSKRCTPESLRETMLNHLEYYGLPTPDHA